MKCYSPREGDRASICLMSFSEPRDGYVESIAGTIVNREAASSGDLIANVNPTFSCVRLAQGIPVRIAIDRELKGMRLSAGVTATVMIEPAVRRER